MTTTDLLAAIDRIFVDVPDEALPGLLDALDEWHEWRRQRSPSCRRESARGLAGCIADQPGMYRHYIGNDDQIADDFGLTGYRMTDFIPEAELGRYRAWMGQGDDPPSGWPPEAAA